MFADTILGIGRTSIFESYADPEIENITPDTVNECAGDPFEFLTAAYYESQLDMMNINQAIMVCEYAYLKENGQEMVYESNVVSTMFKSLGEKIKGVWKKICEFFKSIFSWLEERVRSDKKFVEKYADKVNNIDSVDIGSFKGYTYASTNKVDTNGGTITTAATKMFDYLKTAAKENYDHIVGADNTNITEALDALRGDLVDKKSVTAKEIGDELTKYFRGDEITSGKFNKAQLNTMLDVIASTKVTKANLNNVYKGCKNTVDALLKTAKTEEKNAEKISDKGSDDTTAKGLHAVATILNGITGLVTIVNNKACKALTAQNRQCRAIVGKAVTASSKSSDDKKTTATGESAYINSIFDSFVG